MGRGGTVLGFVPHIGSPVWWLVGSFVAIILLWGVSESFQRLSLTRFAVGLVRDARAAAIARIPAADDRQPGDLIAAVTGDAARVKSGVKTILIGTTRNAAFFVGVTMIVSLIYPVVGLIFFAGGIVTIVVGALGAWRSSRVARRSRRRESEFTDDLHKYFSGHAELPSSAFDPARRPDSKVTRIEGITTLAVHAVLGASAWAILIVSIDAGRSGRLSGGSVFTILAYVMLMHNKTVGFGRRIIRGGRLLPSAERLAKLAGAPPAGNPTSPARKVSIRAHTDAPRGVYPRRPGSQAPLR
jgi:ABC-type multidrug transport system fused ATPase/permease subunit